MCSAFQLTYRRGEALGIDINRLRQQIKCFGREAHLIANSMPREGLVANEQAVDAPNEVFAIQLGASICAGSIPAPELQEMSKTDVVARSLECQAAELVGVVGGLAASGDVCRRN